MIGESLITDKDIENWGVEEYNSVRDLFRNFNPKIYQDVFGNKKRLYFKYEERDDRLKSSIEREVERKLRDYGYEVEDYLKGLAKKKGEKNLIKIGKLLNRANEDNLLDKFKNDRVRASGGSDDLYVVISRHPVDIVTMSSNRDWTSCMDVAKDRYSSKTHISADIKEGSLIAYLIKKSDKNINKPLARILIKPFVNVSDSEDVLLVPDKPYGNPTPSFKANVDAWVDKNLNKGKKFGRFEIKSCIYADGLPEETEVLYDGVIDREKFDNNSDYRKDIMGKLIYIGDKQSAFNIGYAKDFYIVSNGSEKYIYDGDIKEMDDIKWMNGDIYPLGYLVIFLKSDREYRLYRKGDKNNLFEGYNTSGNNTFIQVKKKLGVIQCGNVIIKMDPNPKFFHQKNPFGFDSVFPSGDSGNFYIRKNSNSYLLYSNGKVKTFRSKTVLDYIGDNKFFDNHDTISNNGKPVFKFFETMTTLKAQKKHGFVLLRYDAEDKRKKRVLCYLTNPNKAFSFDMFDSYTYRRIMPIPTTDDLAVIFMEENISDFSKTQVTFLNTRSGKFLMGMKSFYAYGDDIIDFNTINSNGFLALMDAESNKINYSIKDRKIIRGKEYVDGLPKFDLSKIGFKEEVNTL